MTAKLLEEKKGESFNVTQGGERGRKTQTFCATLKLSAAERIAPHLKIMGYRPTSDGNDAQ
jgi:hypothetical protein